MNIAIYPGSFDPITKGHLDVLQAGSEIFDKVIIAVSNNSAKTGFLSVEERVNLIKASIKDMKNVEVDSFEGLTIEYAKRKGAKVLIRGLRAVSDFEYEMQLSQTNSAFLRCLPLAETTFNVVNCFDLSARLFCFELQRLSFTFQSTSLICFYLPNFSA